MDREKILTDDTKNRYVTLKARIINKLLRQVDKKVYSWKSCDKLVDIIDRNIFEITFL